MPLKKLSVFSTLLIVAAIVSLIFLHGVFSTRPIVIALQLIAFGLMVWARITFGMRSFHLSANPTEGGLVTNGPYHYMRHPIYSAILLFVWTGVLANLSLLNGFLGLVITLGTGIRIYCEEQFLRSEYSEYAEYEKNTKRIIPFVF